MRAGVIAGAPLAALLLLVPIAACSSEPEQQVCAVLEADGDDYVPIRDPALCPPPGAAAAAEGPLWVPVSWLDDDDDRRTYRTTRPSPATVRPSPSTTTAKPPRTTTRTTTRTSSR